MRKQKIKRDQDSKKNHRALQRDHDNKLLFLGFDHDEQAAAPTDRRRIGL